MSRAILVVLVLFCGSCFASDDDWKSVKQEGDITLDTRRGESLYYAPQKLVGAGWFCPNDCSGHGNCVYGGFCLCYDGYGYTGADCSKSELVSMV